MKNARRNKILFWSYTAVCVVLSGTLVGVMLIFSGDRPPRPTLLAAATAGFVGCWAWWIGSVIRDNRALRNLESELEESGAPGPDEEPIPLRLAESRESLIVSLIMLALIAAALVAYFGGWIG